MIIYNNKFVIYINLINAFKYRQQRNMIEFGNWRLFN